MGFLIDTSIWIEVERGKLAPADVASITGQEPVYISPISIAELSYGVEVSPNPDIKQKRLAAINRLKRKPLLLIDEVTGEIFGGLAAQLDRSGRGYSFRIHDLWLASQAIQHTFRLLTKNEKDFIDIPGLQLTTL